MDYGHIIKSFIAKHRIRDLLDKPPLNEINLLQPTQNLPYVVAAIIKTARTAGRRVEYDKLLYKLGLTEEDIARSYRELYGNWYPFHKYFPDGTGDIDSNRFVPLEISKTDARALGRKGLIRGKNIDGELFGDKEQWYIPIPDVVRVYQLPKWYLCYKINEGCIRTKNVDEEHFVNIADTERIKEEFIIDKWIKLTDAARLYGLRRQRVSQIAKKRGLRTIRIGEKTIYVAGKDMEDVMKEVPPNTTIISTTRAQKILGVDNLDSYIKDGRLRGVQVGGSTLLTVKSVIKLRNTRAKAS